MLMLILGRRWEQMQVSDGHLLGQGPLATIWAGIFGLSPLRSLRSLAR